MEISLLHRKESIILATIDVIDQYGILGLSTREVAKRVGISEPTIFKHFKTKTELMLAVLDHFTQYDKDIIVSIKTKKLTPVEAIKFYINTYATYYENYPAITSLTQIYDVLRCDKNYTERIQSIISEQIGFIAGMLKQAQLEGEINPTVDSDNLSVTIMGINRECCLEWRMYGYTFSLRERMVSIVEMVLEAFKAKNDGRV